MPPSLSSPRKSRQAQWQLEQMFSLNAQMGTADKHQQSAEKETWGKLQNPHSNCEEGKNSGCLGTQPQSPGAAFAATLMADGAAELRVYSTERFTEME